MSVVDTKYGPIDQSRLTTRSADVEHHINDEHHIYGVRHWLLGDEVVRQDVEEPVVVVDGCVYTTQGMVPLADLERVHDEVDEGPLIMRGRTWFRAGELVRRDVWGVVKTGLESQIQQGN